MPTTLSPLQSQSKKELQTPMAKVPRDSLIGSLPQSSTEMSDIWLSYFMLKNSKALEKLKTER